MSCLSMGPQTFENGSTMNHAILAVIVVKVNIIKTCPVYSVMYLFLITHLVFFKVNERETRWVFDIQDQLNNNMIMFQHFFWMFQATGAASSRNFKNLTNISLFYSLNFLVIYICEMNDQNLFLQNQSLLKSIGNCDIEKIKENL